MKLKDYSLWVHMNKEDKRYLEAVIGDRTFISEEDIEEAILDAYDMD